MRRESSFTQTGGKITISRRGAGLAAVSIAVLLWTSAAPAQAARELSIGAHFTHYLFDADYFGIGNGSGADIVVRCEIGRFFWVENRLGGYAASQDGTSIRGISGQLGIITFLPYLIPYRPTLRAGLALLTCNPVVSPPVPSFTPSQTVLYGLFGGGMSWSIRSRVQIEFGADLLITPYQYRVYTFQRQYVEASRERFIHAAFTLGATYAF